MTVREWQGEKRKALQQWKKNQGEGEPGQKMSEEKTSASWKG